MKIFLMGRMKAIYRNQGFTVIEVIIVLALMAIVLIPAINAISVTNHSWIHNDSINPYIAQANTAMTWISREIRGAAQPSNSANSVIVEDSGQRLIIYRYNENSSVWEKVVYQVNANKLSRIVLSNADPAVIISTAIPAGSNAGWNSLLDGITSTPVFSLNGSRTVNVNLQVSDTGRDNPRFSPFSVASTYLVRSREVGAITGDPVSEVTTPPVVAVRKVVLDVDQATLRILGVKEATLTVTVWPANATDKSVTWTTSHPSWVTVTPINNGNQAIIKVIKTKADFTSIQWNLFRVTYFPPDVTITATPNGGGNSDNCTVIIRKNA
ncbi:MAG TPA: prepilin-type N-terminal cleavage/methylation domain-containing protein [Syntrophomonadaceae bacterium]|nr:prepilin-type N-terminal cleavage/methylation domain-containing protein [Syntrophomonadaceae bacterium]